MSIENTSITLCKEEHKRIMTYLETVIISLNERICYMVAYPFFDGELIPVKDNMRRLFLVFETLNDNPKHLFYSLKTLHENLKNV